MKKQTAKIFSISIVKTAVIFCVLAVFFLIGAPFVFALDTGLEFAEQTGLGTQDIRITIMKIVRVILGFVGFIALIIVIYGGFIWMTSAGNPEKVDQAKKILRNGLIGLAIILFSFAIATFIINALLGFLGSGGPGGPDGPDPCDNCDHLGSGIIERVYPEPFAREVPRNTNISVTFKQVMDHETIISGVEEVDENGDGETDLWKGLIDSDHVQIYVDEEDDDARLQSDEVLVSTRDRKQYTFNPVAYLGDGIENVWYAVTLTGGIEKDNGESAFPGIDNDFTWRFEIGTILDLDPPQISTLFPPPDNAGDNYAISEPIAATGVITVVQNPFFAQQATASAVTPGTGSPTARTLGAYTCSRDASVETFVQAVAGKLELVTETTPASAGFIPRVPITAQTRAASIGCGLSLELDANPTSGNSWSFNVTSQKNADTLRIGSREYTFVNGASEGMEIARGSTQENTAQEIATAINNDKDSSVDAVSSEATVTLTARTSGTTGNAIVVSASGTWAEIISMRGGSDATLQPSEEGGTLDQPRNVIITLDFNEPINQAAVNDDVITVFYNNSKTETQNWQEVAGSLVFSNQYKTVDFIPANVCVDASGQPIQNACGEGMYCLPTVEYGEGETYRATEYKVEVHPARLKYCDAQSCNDGNFSFCVDLPGDDTNKACNQASDGSGAFYPESDADAGAMDMANNSFNGNFNTATFATSTFGRADGPEFQSGNVPYRFNEAAVTTGRGDDSTWSFYVNKNIKLSAPVVTKISPTVGQSGIDLNTSATSLFDGVMMSSTLKPGSNYEDGVCTCNPDNGNDDCGDGELCDPVRRRCVAQGGTEQLFCSEDSQCGGDNNQCINKKYVSLIDTSSRPVGWWVVKNNIDEMPRDLYPEQTEAVIDHTRFYEITRYGAEIGSGVKDVYQNCFLPSEGPTSVTCNPADGANCCPVTAESPYCCDGNAMDFEDWQDSQCFTGQ